MSKIFKNNPQLKEYFETSDGTAFYTENSAKNHAKELENKTVKRVEREKEVVEETTDEVPDYDMSMTREELDAIAVFYEVDTSEAEKKQDVIDAIDAKLKSEDPESDAADTSEKTEDSDKGADSEDSDKSKA